MTYRWTGTLSRGAAPGTVSGELHDGFGNTIAITGSRGPLGYELVGTPGPMPSWLEIPLLDDGEV